MTKLLKGLNEQKTPDPIGLNAEVPMSVAIFTLLKQTDIFYHHKIRKAFSKFYHRHSVTDEPRPG